MSRRSVVIILWLALLELLWLLLPIPHSRVTAVHTFAIDAGEYAYTPGRIKVNKGDRVTFRLTSHDVVHGFFLDAYDIDERVTPGITQPVVFTADRTGRFSIRCSVQCGPLHPFMVGELVVSPNESFVKSVGAVLIAFSGMLYFLWQSGRSFNYE